MHGDLGAVGMLTYLGEIDWLGDPTSSQLAQHRGTKIISVHNVAHLMHGRIHDATISPSVPRSSPSMSARAFRTQQISQSCSRRNWMTKGHPMFWCRATCKSSCANSTNTPVVVLAQWLLWFSPVSWATCSGGFSGSFRACGEARQSQASLGMRWRNACLGEERLRLPRAPRSGRRVLRRGFHALATSRVS